MKRSKRSRTVVQPNTPMSTKTLLLLTSNPAWDRFYIPSTAPIRVQTLAVQLGLTLQ